MGTIVYVVDFIKRNGISEETAVCRTEDSKSNLLYQFHL